MSWRDHQYLSYNNHAQLSERFFLKYIKQILYNEHAENSYRDRVEILCSEISNRICLLGSQEYRKMKKQEKKI